jgi:hypothetical protein
LSVSAANINAAALSLIFEDNLRFHFLPFIINGKIDMGNPAGGLIACMIYPCNPEHSGFLFSSV